MQNTTYLFAGLLLLTAGCSSNKEEPAQRRLNFFQDTSKPYLASGYYLVVDSTVKGSVRKVVHTLEPKGYMNGETVFLHPADFVSFAHTDSVFVNDYESDAGTRHELIIWFNTQGTMELSRLTTEQFPGQYSSMEVPIKLGTVVNNTLVQVAAVMNKIQDGKIAMNGPYLREDLEQIREEILKSRTQKNSR